MNAVELAFVVVWVALGIVSVCFFYGSRNARLKRAVFPWFVIGVGVLFAGFVVLMTWQWRVLLIVVPAVALISYLNIRFTKFCDSCGATLYNSLWFSRMSFCSRCGASLECSSSPSGDREATH